MQSTVKAIFAEWSQALKIDKLKSDLSKVAGDINAMKQSIGPQTAKTLAQAEKKYKEIVSKISLAQNQWNAEAKKASELLKKTSKEVESILTQSKKIADKQKADLKQALGTKGNAVADVKLAVKKTVNSKKVKTVKVKAAKVVKAVKSTVKAKAPVVVKAATAAKNSKKAKANGKAKAKSPAAEAVATN